MEKTLLPPISPNGFNKTALSPLTELPNALNLSRRGSFSCPNLVKQATPPQCDLIEVVSVGEDSKCQRPRRSRMIRNIQLSESPASSPRLGRRKSRMSAVIQTDHHTTCSSPEPALITPRLEKTAAQPPRRCPRPDREKERERSLPMQQSRDPRHHQKQLRELRPPSGVSEGVFSRCLDWVLSVERADPEPPMDIFECTNGLHHQIASLPRPQPTCITLINDA